MAILLDGKKLAEVTNQKTKERVQLEILEKHLPAPFLAIIRVGEDAGSGIYIKKKVALCNELGIHAETFCREDTITQKELLELVEKLNNDSSITGIILQLPLPKNLDAVEAISKISSLKDVDGLTSKNLGLLVDDSKNGIAPCTPLGVVTLLEKYNIPLEGKKVCVLGRSILVGKPLALMLLNKNATVTICHSKTQNVEEITAQSDVVICAIGKKHFLKANMVKKAAVVVDIGVSRDENGKVCGDVDFENVEKIASYITPNPGGVGPMTVAMLMQNVLTTYFLQR